LQLQEGDEMADSEREERVVVHGVGSIGPMVNVILQAGGISQFVESYRAYRDDISSMIPTIQNKANGCVKTDPERWMEDCVADSHPTWETMVVLRRGALKEPTKSGANAGQKRDPSVDFNYRWEIARFIDGPSPKPVSVDGKKTASIKVDSAQLAQLHRTFDSNDRTALMSAVEFGKMGDNANILDSDEVLNTAVKWANELNTRAYRRVSDLLGHVEDRNEIKEEPVEPIEPTKEVSPVRNMEHVKAELVKLGIDNETTKKVLADAGYNKATEWLAKNGEDYAGLLSFIQNGANSQW
jgi:hypothetical protein